VISDKDVEFYRENGYVLVENLLDRDTREQMKAVIADLRPFVERRGDLDMLSKEAIRKLLERT